MFAYPKSLFVFVVLCLCGIAFSQSRVVREGGETLLRAEHLLDTRDENVRSVLEVSEDHQEWEIKRIRFSDSAFSAAEGEGIAVNSQVEEADGVWRVAFDLPLASNVFTRVGHEFGPFAPEDTEVNGFSIEVLEACGTALGDGESFAIMGPDLFGGGSWSHAATDFGDFPGLKLAEGSYPAPAHVADEKCEGAKTFSGMWVKKLHDWDRNHVTGAYLPLDGPAMSTIDTLVIDLYMDPELSYVPSSEEIQDTFGISKTLADSIDFGGDAILGLYLQQDAVDGWTPHAAAYVPIPEAYQGYWLRIRFPMDAFWFYEQNDNYQRRASSYEAQSNLGYKQLFLNPETYGSRAYDDESRTYQHLGNGPHATPLYKEMHFSIYRIDFELKE